MPLPAGARFFDAWMMAVTFVLLLGEIDLAAGYTAGVTGAVLALRLEAGWGLLPAILLAGLVSLLLGMWTGVLVAKLGIPAFVVTLANFLVFQGILLLLVKEGGSVRIEDKIVKGVVGSSISPGLSWVIGIVGILARAGIAGAGRRPVGIEDARREGGVLLLPAARDPAEMARLNDAAFAQMFAVLDDGGTIGIFPEGLSHDASQLARLKTGAARLALGSAARAGAPRVVIPCGLTFIHPKRFRSRVLVQYGPPLAIAADPSPDAVRRVTDEIDQALRRLTINAPDWDTVRALDTVRRLYQPPGISIEQRVELARRFNAHYPAVADDPRVVALMARVAAYRDRLDELGVADRELVADLSRGQVGARLARHLVLLLWWLPLTVPAAPLHVPPLVFARFAGARLTPRKDVVATTKMMVGMLLVLAAYALAIGLVFARLGLGWGAFACVLLPISGWATLRVLDRARLVRRAFGVLARRLRFRHAVIAARAERAALVTEVIRVVGELRPDGLDALFPAHHALRAPA